MWSSSFENYSKQAARKRIEIVLYPTLNMELLDNIISSSDMCILRTDWPHEIKKTMSF